MASLKYLAAAALGSLVVALPAAAQDDVSRSAAAYGTYQADVGETRDGPLDSLSDLDRAVDSIGGHNPDNVSRGVIAYGAMVAGQSPEFRRSVREMSAAYPSGQFAKAMTFDPRWARQKVDGASQAAAAALAATDADGRMLSESASIMKERAFRLEGAGWAKARVKDNDSIVARLEASSQSGAPLDGNVVGALSRAESDGTLASAGRNGAPSLWRSMAGAVRVPATVNPAGRLGTTRSTLSSSETADRIVALAAYRLAGGAPNTSAQSLMLDRRTSQCLNLGQLELQGCVAAAHTQNELAHCLSAQMKRSGTCVDGVSQ